jgi:hypothetical protein
MVIELLIWLIVVVAVVNTVLAKSSSARGAQLTGNQLSLVSYFGNWWPWCFRMPDVFQAWHC